MSVNDALDEIEKIIASAWRIPMTKGKCAVSVEELQILIDDVRLSLPKEIKQAKIIVENRNDILSDARQEIRPSPLFERLCQLYQGQHGGGAL